MKKLVFLLILFIIPAAHATPNAFNFSGKGFGHGVGLSQIGARAMALQGATAIEILTHYFPGTEILAVPDNQILRVNIGHKQKTIRLTIASKTGSIQIFNKKSEDLNESPLTPLTLSDKKGAITFTTVGNRVSVSVINSGIASSLPLAKEMTIKWNPETVVKVSPGGVTYQFGQMQIKSVKSLLELTNSVSLHNEYLYGVSEMPSSWSPAALEAQIITARTYASRKANNIRVECDCDLFGSTKDLNFVGNQKISEPKWGGQWKAAVDATAIDGENGYVISYMGMPISAFFFSSSAGITDSSKNAFGSASPYLVSVPDPGSQDAKLNPRFYKWVRSVSQEKIAKAFGLSDVVAIQIISRNATDSVAKVQGISNDGKKVILKGETFRFRTGLPSTWFYLI